MRRRRVWIIVGTALALSGLVLTFALLPRSPLRILDGHSKVGPNSVVPSGQNAYYSFAAEPDALVRRARDEVEARGFEILRYPPEADVSLAAGDKSALRGEMNRVWIWKDKRLIERRGTQYWQDRPGWVTVGIRYEGAEPGLWDRVKGVLGL